MVQKYLFLICFLRLDFVTSFREESQMQNHYWDGMIQTERNYLNPCMYWQDIELRVAVCNAVVKLIKMKNLDYSNFHYSFVTNKITPPECIPVTINIKDYDCIQIVLPCFGVHDPVRTSLTIDDYYDEFFISLGTSDSRIMLYKKNKYPAAPHVIYTGQAAAPVDIYTPIDEYDIYFDSLEIVDLSQYDLPEDSRWSYTNGAEAELIDLREMVPLRKTDNLQNKLRPLDKNKFLELCQALFNRPEYYNKGFCIDVNNHNRLATRPVSDVFYMVYRTYYNYNGGQKLKRRVYPCYGIREYGPKVYYISSGPRNFESKTSVMIYLLQNDELRPIELVENIDLQTL